MKDMKSRKEALQETHECLRALRDSTDEVRLCSPALCSMVVSLSSFMLFMFFMVRAVRGICVISPYGWDAEMSAYTRRRSHCAPFLYFSAYGTASLHSSVSVSVSVSRSASKSKSKSNRHGGPPAAAALCSG